MNAFIALMPIFGYLRAVITLTLLLATAAGATPQTVGDEACPKYAVDIAAFATCEGEHVVKPAADDLVIPPRALVDDAGIPLLSSADAIPRDPLSQTHGGHYLSADEAHAAKRWLGTSVLFVDVRDEASVAASGLPQNADFNLAVGRQMPNGRIQAAQGFVAHIKQSLASRHLKHDAPIFVICENGRHAAFAAELLAHAGVPNVFVVRGGISGEETEGGKSTGWMAARLPMRPASRLPA